MNTDLAVLPSYLNLNYLSPLSAPYFASLAVSVAALLALSITTKQSPVVLAFSVSSLGLQELIVSVSFDLAAQIGA